MDNWFGLRLITLVAIAAVVSNINSEVVALWNLPTESLGLALLSTTCLKTIHRRPKGVFTSKDRNTLKFTSPLFRCPSEIRENMCNSAVMISITRCPDNLTRWPSTCPRDLTSNRQESSFQIAHGKSSDSYHLHVIHFDQIYRKMIFG